MTAQLDLLAGVAPPAPGLVATYLEAGADVCPTGLYRWTLRRRWVPAGPTIAWVMFNPSTADGREDDPTIRRCVAFSRREGAAALVVVNLFAWRTTDPRELLAPLASGRAVGDRNDASILAAVAEADVVVAAWGANYPDEVEERLAVVRLLLAERPVRSLGMTKAGAPRHPLYVRGDQPLVEYRP